MHIPQLESKTDEELIAAFVGSGDHDALEVLLRRHEGRVYGLAARVLGNRDDALEVTQDVFLTLFRRASSFRGDAAFTTWLYRLTLNACTDLGRKKSRAPIPTEEVAAEAASLSGMPTSSQVEDRMVVEAALEQIIPEQRVAVVLRDMYQMSYDQIAELTDSPVGTVKSRISRGRLALAKVMAPSTEPGETSPRLNEG